MEGSDSDSNGFVQGENVHEITRVSCAPGLETGKTGIRRRSFRQDSEVYFESGEGRKRGQVVPLRSVSNFPTSSGIGKKFGKRKKARPQDVEPKVDTEHKSTSNVRKDQRENNKPEVDANRKTKQPSRWTDFNFSLIWSVPERYENPKPGITVVYQIRDFLLNFSLFIAITFLLFGSSSQLANYYSNVVSEVIIESKFKIPNSSPKSFQDIRRYTEIWQFLDQVLLKVLYPNNSTLGRLLKENVLLGRPRMRQVRVKSQTCSTAGLFEPFYTTCYDYYHYTVEDKRPFGLKSSAWTYKGEQSGERSDGKISTYEDGGFMFEFDRQLNETQKTVDELEANAWVRLGTGAVILDLALYSPNADKFSAIKLIFEILPTGGVMTSWRVGMLKNFAHLNAHILVIGREIFSAICILYYTVELGQKLFFKKYKFLTSFWNVLDVLLVLSGWVMFFDSLRYLMERRSIAGRLATLMNSKNYESFDYIVRVKEHRTVARCAVVILVIVRFFKITIIRPITMVTLTISCVGGELLVLSFLHVAFVMGFAVLGNTLFGVVIQFRSLWESFYTLYCLFIGGLSFIVDCERVDPIWTQIFFAVYIFACLAIFFNAYIALVIVGYQRALLRIEYLDEVAYFEEICANAMYKLVDLCFSQRLIQKLRRRRIGGKHLRDRQALVPILRRYECRGLHSALLLKKHELGSSWTGKTYDEDKIYSEIHLRNQLLMEVEQHEKIAQQLEKVVKSLDFMDQNLSDITSKVDYLVNKVISKK